MNTEFVVELSNTTASLAGLAVGIEQEHQACTKALREGVEHAIKAGELLRQAKSLCGHGEWGRWLKENCTVSERTAQGYMRVARELPKLLEANPQRVADLSFRESLKLLGEGKPDRAQPSSTYSQTKNLRRIEFHPETYVVPMMTDKEFAGLKESIAEHGLLVPIVIHDGKVLDGRCRYLACQELGIVPKSVTWNQKGTKLEFIISMNLFRQSYSEDQRAAIAVKAMKLVEEEAEDKSSIPYSNGREDNVLEQAQAFASDFDSVIEEWKTVADYKDEEPLALNYANGEKVTTKLETQPRGEVVALKTPYKDLLPPLATIEFDALKASIQKYGVLDPIDIDEEGNILDGHHRYQICKDAPTRVITGLSKAEKLAFVYRSSMVRRNLSPEQKKELRKK